MSKMFLNKSLLAKFSFENENFDYQSEESLGCSSSCDGTCDGTIVGEDMCTYSDSYITYPVWNFIPRFESICNRKLFFGEQMIIEHGKKYTLMLTVTEKCNLNCVYCYEGIKSENLLTRNFFWRLTLNSR